MLGAMMLQKKGLGWEGGIRNEASGTLSRKPFESESFRD